MTQEQQYSWDDAVAAIGKDFSGGKEQAGQEKIAYNDVVRYCEVWEFGNPLYWDEAAAKQAGYRGVVVPWSSIKQTFTYNGFWRPGEPTRFPTQDLDVSMSNPAREQGERLPTPPTTTGVVTDVEIEFFESACVGDQLTVKGDKVVNVRPRQTRIGYGAFVNRANDIFNQRGELVARVNQGVYSYNPGEPPKQG